MRVEDEYLDVLQNLEFAIVTEFRKDGAILDLNVLDAVNALVRPHDSPQSASITHSGLAKHRGTWTGRHRRPCWRRPALQAL